MKFLKRFRAWFRDEERGIPPHTEVSPIDVLTPVRTDA
ncbi:hypothetical protein CGOTT_11810 [Corynebacterium gottingense]|nr:hypothetical protein CGOTT_11810 [Corynebacterium gottingense]WJZ16564.1 hypothetical protein CGOTTB_11750 [Corynebacterium gottingense]